MIYLRQVSIVKYISDEGMVMMREWGLTPNGNELGGRWVLRDSENRIIDYDQYRNDLAERNNVILID